MKWCFLSPGVRSKEVFLGSTKTSGGAEAQLVYLATLIARKGHDVLFIYGDGHGGASSQVVNGVTCVDAAPSWRRPTSVLEFWRTLNAFSPDVLFATLPYDFLWLFGLFAGLHRNARFVYWVAHDLHCSPWGSYDYKKWLHEPLYALALQSADRIAI